MELYDNCPTIFASYKQVMNNMVSKTQIIKKIFKDKKWETKGITYIGSYMTYPDDEREKVLKKFYEKTTDAKSFTTTVQSLAKSVERGIGNGGDTICFILGSVVDTDNISHHVSFLYHVRDGVLKMFDPGQQSWAPEYSIIVKNVAMTALRSINDKVELVETYSIKRSNLDPRKGFCTREKCGPQDVTRGRFYNEMLAVFNKWYNLHRETFCQTWSVAILIVYIELSTTDVHQDQLEYWEMRKNELEIYIREVILWIVSQDKDTFQYAYDQERIKEIAMEHVKTDDPVLIERINDTAFKIISDKLFIAMFVRLYGQDDTRTILAQQEVARGISLFIETNPSSSDADINREIKRLILLDNVPQKPQGFMDDDYLTILLHCMKHFNKNIEIPSELPLPSTIVKKSRSRSPKKSPISASITTPRRRK